MNHNYPHNEIVARNRQQQVEETDRLQVAQVEVSDGDKDNVIVVTFEYFKN